MDNYLNDVEKQKLVDFCNDVKMREAVKKVLLASVYENGTLKAGEKPDPKRNFILAIANKPELSNEVLGQEVRAAYWGITIIEDAYKKLESYKPVEVESASDDNEAL